jgi:hypothetical protein
VTPVSWIAVGTVAAIVVVTFWVMLREGPNDKRPWASEFGADDDEAPHSRSSSGKATPSSDASAESAGDGGGDD